MVLSNPGQTRPGKPLHKGRQPGTGEADICEREGETAGWQRSLFVRLCP